MPDTPDFYEYLPGSDRYSLSDMGELVVRLGSPVTYDRRGEVIWYDMMDRGLSPYVVSAYGTGAAARVTAVYTGMGHYCMELTAGSTLLMSITLMREFVHLGLQRVGVEIGVSFYTLNDYFRLWLSRYENGVCHYPGINLSAHDRTLSYRDKDNVWQVLYNTGQLEGWKDVFHHLKLVVDYMTGKYVRVMFNDHEFNMSDIEYYKITTGEENRYFLEFGLFSRPGYNDVCYVDHVIITGNEP